MTADRREVFISILPVCSLSFAHWTRKVQMVLREDICAKLSLTPHRVRTIHRFQTGPLSVNPKSTNDVPTRDEREQAPHLTLQRPFLSCCQGSDRGMVRVDRSAPGKSGRALQPSPTSPVLPPPYLPPSLHN